MSVGKSNAMKVILTGEPINPETALKMGVISDVFPHENLLQETFFFLFDILYFLFTIIFLKYLV